MGKVAEFYHRYGIDAGGNGFNLEVSFFGRLFYYRIGCAILKCKSHGGIGFTDVCLLRMVFQRNTVAQIGNTRKKECASGAVGGMLRKQTVFVKPELVRL